MQLYVNGKVLEFETPFITEEEASAKGLTISTVMSECPNLCNGVKLGHFHPGQAEESKIYDVMENIPVESMAPCKAFIKGGSEDWIPVEVNSIQRELDVILEDGTRQKVETENEPVKVTLERLSAKLASRRNNKVTWTNLETGEKITHFQRFGFFIQERKPVVVRKHIQPHIHMMVDNGSGRCHTSTKCSICGATYTCDSSD